MTIKCKNEDKKKNEATQKIMKKIKIKKMVKKTKQRKTTPIIIVDPQHSNNFGWFYKAEGEGELYKYKQAEMNVVFFQIHFQDVWFEAATS